MRRALETDSSDPAEGEREINYVLDTIRKFTESLDSAFPLRRLRNFCDEKKIKEFAEKEREKLYKEFFSRVLKFRGDQFWGMWKDVESGIEKATDDLITNHRRFMEEAATFVEEIHCMEFKKCVELKLSMDPLMNLEKLEKMLEVVKMEILKSFPNDWRDSHCPHALRDLNEKLKRIKMEFERKQREFLLGPGQGPSSSSATAAATDTTVIEVKQRDFLEQPGPSNAISIANYTEHVGPSSTPINNPEKTQKIFPEFLGSSSDSAENLLFMDLQQWISKKVRVIKGDRCPNFPTFQNLGSCHSSCKSELQSIIEKMIRHLDESFQFSAEEYKKIHSKLEEVLLAAQEVLIHSFKKPGPDKEKNSLREEDFAAWFQALELDLKQCFCTQTQVQFQLASDCELGLLRQAWVVGLTNAKRYDIETKDKDFRWTGETFQKFHVELCKMDAEIEKSKKNERFEPEMLLIKLARILKYDLEIREQAKRAYKPRRRN